jgi:asparagine synthase (glutamine-hydrolysing)
MIEGVRERMLDAVRTRLRADVPVGIYLSGGIDSSVIAGMVTHLIKEEGVKVGSKDPKERVCCFSIAFDEESGFDESSKSSVFQMWTALTLL